MEVAVKSYKHCEVVSVKGRVDSSTAPKLTETFDKLHRDGHYKLVLDLSETEYMSSAGFRAILAAQKESKKYNRGEVVLARVPQLIHEALELTGMAVLFKTFDDLTAAVGSF